MDDDGTGYITLDEFEHNLSDERVVAYFNALQLDVSDARTLFRLLDYDNSNEVNIDEFLIGCYKLQGASRTLDMKIMQYEFENMRQSILGLIDTVNELMGTASPTRQVSKETN